MRQGLLGSNPHPGRRESTAVDGRLPPPAGVDPSRPEGGGRPGPMDGHGGSRAVRVRPVRATRAAPSAIAGVARLRSMDLIDPGGWRSSRPALIDWVDRSRRFAQFPARRDRLRRSIGADAAFMAASSGPNPRIRSTGSIRRGREQGLGRERGARHEGRSGWDANEVGRERERAGPGRERGQAGAATGTSGSPGRRRRAARTNPAKPADAPTAKQARSPAAGSAPLRTPRAMRAPPTPVPRAVPRTSLSCSPEVAAPFPARRGVAQDRQRQRRVGQAHPEPGEGPGEEARPRRAPPARAPARTRPPRRPRRGTRSGRAGSRRAGRSPLAWTQAPAVHDRVAPVRAIPATRRAEAATGLEGEWDVGVGAEEREGEDPAQEDRGGQPALGPKRACRGQGSERGDDQEPAR